MLSSVTAGIAGFLSTLRFTAGSAVIGDPLLLSSIAAVIIGGVSLFGGAGSDHRHGDRLADHRRADHRPRHARTSQAFWQFIVVGVVVIVAVLIDQSRDLIVGRDRAGRAGMTEPVLSVRDLIKRFGGLTAVNARQPRRLRRRGGGAARRQRRRQVDADQVRLRRPRRRRGRDPASSGKPVRFATPDRRPQPRHRDDLPGPRARQQSRRARQHLPRPRAEEPLSRRARQDPRRADDAARSPQAALDALEIHFPIADPADREPLRRPAPGGRHRPRRLLGRAG